MVGELRAGSTRGGNVSASGDWIRDAGGEIGSSGRSSRNRDIVRFGTLELTRRGGRRLGGGVGACIVCMESREVLENEDGSPELRLFLLPHLKNEAHDLVPFVGVPVSDSFEGCSDCSVFASDGW